MGKSRDLSEFERGMIVGARSAGCSISETVKRLGFSKTAVSRVYREWCEKRKTSSHRGSCGRKRLVDESGEKRMERVVEANIQATSEQIQTLYNSSAPEKPISLATTRRTLKRLGYSRKTQRRDSLIVAGLEALAVYASCPQLETDKNLVCRVQGDPDSKTQSSTGVVFRDQVDPAPKTLSSTGVVFRDQGDPDPKTHSSTGFVFRDQGDPDPKTQSSTGVVFRDQGDPALKTQSSTGVVFRDQGDPALKTQSSTGVVFRDQDDPHSKTKSSTGVVFRDQDVVCNDENDPE
ncbi:uncharacterized protein LOC117770271 isoform X2 [Hippoglossus hippoglossus]|uniref:uncharacterized protein LOC117770271 isoform X2 n=1 Tax=Hippoglossus hippoglossus TaxID=8267 RepID=UPI00148D916B|nr:uncharacterized protein LOC117770271 isoform X2 [Hippoglossus hippoglossus]